VVPLKPCAVMSNIFTRCGAWYCTGPADQPSGSFHLNIGGMPTSPGFSQ